MWSKNILETIGNTPLVQINNLATDLPCTLLAKVEFFNPGGSVKDRIALKMIEDAEMNEKLKPGGTIIEGTSGNTGAGLALVAIAKGYHCIFTTTDKQSQEKIDVLRGLGAEVIICPTNVAPEDPRSYYSVAKRLSEEIPNSVYPNQYDNPANPLSHYETTGPELWEQTEGKITHYVAGAGTGGSLCGTAKFLKEKNPSLKAIGVDPYGSVYYKYFFERVFDEKEIYPYITEGVGEDILAGNMDFSIVDDYVRVSDKDSMQMTRRLAREEGLFVGGSCGMAMAGALQWIQKHKSNLTPEDVIVVMLPDSGFRYLSKIYSDAWMQDHGFFERTPFLTAGEILSLNGKNNELIAIKPHESVDHVIHLMTKFGISQIPVIDETKIVGSLTEKSILSKLIETPNLREKSVNEIMGVPFPIISKQISLEQLSSYFDEGVEAVLVQENDPINLRILTRSDLIRALAKQSKKTN